MHDYNNSISIKYTYDQDESLLTLKEATQKLHNRIKSIYRTTPAKPPFLHVSRNREINHIAQIMLYTVPPPSSLPNSKNLNMQNPPSQNPRRTRRNLNLRPCTKPTPYHNNPHMHTLTRHRSPKDPRNRPFQQRRT